MFLATKKGQQFKRPIAALLLVCLLSEIVFPTAALALTSGNTQPEITAYQPVDATDNVSLVNGRFNYTIPITSIPEYPMALGYSSGTNGMEYEAGVFGLGFSSFPGAISRNMSGLPDDLNNGTVKYEFDNQKLWDGYLGGSYSMDKLGISKGTFQVSPTVSATIGYNNYTGFYGAIGIGVGVKAKLAGNKSALLGAGLNVTSLTSDSRTEGVIWGAGAGLGVLFLRNSGKNFPLGLLGYQVSKVMDGKGSKLQKGGYILGVSAKSQFNIEDRASVSTLASTAYVVPYTKATGFGLSCPIPAVPGLSIDVGYHQTKFNNEPIEKKAFGFEYLYANNYDVSNTDHLPDMSIEGEDSYNDESINNPSYLQYDNFNINTMGLSGSMRLFQTGYGIVSRNYQRQQTTEMTLLGPSLRSTEVRPWYRVTKMQSMTGIDLLSILKKKPADGSFNDIDKALFEEKEIASFQNRNFNGVVNFKMRGDMAGEYNISSDDYKDHQPNSYSLTYMNKTDDWRAVFLGAENGVPQYFPDIDYTDQQAYYNSGAPKRGTVIKKLTMSEVLNHFNQYKDIDGNMPSTTNSADPYNPFNFNQSIFSHYESSTEIADDANSGSKAKYFGDNLYNANLKYLNILDHIQKLKNGSDQFGDLIGSIEVQNTSGLKYYFGLPVFVKKSVSVQLLGHGEKGPEKNGGEYNTMTRGANNKAVNRGKLKTTHDYMYPYAWLVTAIVGEDYIDFDNIPGPSDGDIGYWVKFKYIKGADNYKWRFPFVGMNHYPGKYHTADDDLYSANYGEKEIYYISEIESSNYKCRYQYQKRFDGLESNGLVSGDAYNIQFENDVNGGDNTGNQSLYAVTQIDLFKKHNNGFNSDSKVNGLNPKNWFGANNNTTIKEIPIKSTKFYYDYSQCPGVPNNLSNYKVITAKNVPYHLYYDDINAPTPSALDRQIGRGKLTLRKIQHIAYDENGKPTKLPSYNFEYFGDTPNQDPENPKVGSASLKYNPSYDKNNFDQWGNYMSNTKDVQHRMDGGSGQSIGVCDYNTHYTEYIKSIADENARVFALKKIMLPSGGEMEIDYQSGSYGFVEDQTPFVMRHVLKIEGINGQNKAKLTVDITDIKEANPSLDLTTAKTTDANGVQRPVLEVGDSFYGEIAFYKNTKNHDPSKLYISGGKVRVVSIDPTVTTSSDYKGSRSYQTITVESYEESNSKTGFDQHHIPFVDDCITYMYNESFESRAIKETLSIPFNCGTMNDVLDRYEAYEKDNGWDALRKIAANVKNRFIPAPNFRSNFRSCFGDPGTDIYPHLSYLSTRIFKGKYTGAVVKSIKLRDNFNYATDASQSNGYSTNSNEYGTNYYYDLESNGNSTSSGVTALEPGGGESCVINQLKTSGAGFMPGPNIYFSRSAVENHYHTPNTTPAQSGDVISREKGKTIYEFYTSKDPGYQFGRNFYTGPCTNAPGPAKGSFNLFGILLYLHIKKQVFGVKINIKIPIGMLPYIVNWRREDRYYLRSYAYSDYSDIFGRPKSIVQQDEKGQQLGQQKFTYFDFDEPVNVYKDNFNAPTSVKKPGKIDQVWSEAYFTKETKMRQFSLVLTASTLRKFAYTNMKYSYFPPVLKKVESTFDGIATSTENMGFDYFTGTPIDIRSSDSYGNVKIARTVPAYWLTANADMGSNDADVGKINNLTATAQTYMYLNGVSNADMLGAGVVTWEAGNLSVKKWNTVPYLQPQLNYISASNANYTYNYVPGNNIQNAYNYQAFLNEVSTKPIARNKNIFRPHMGYTYETALNTTGTFSNFVPFNNGAGNGWKALSTNELYAANGTLVQTKDVLGKYASQLVGYNNSNTYGATSNGSWGSSIHEGAENNYLNKSTGAIMLEGDRVKLVDAKIVGAGAKEWDEKRFCYQLFKQPARKLIIQVPANPAYNTPLVKLDVSFINSVGQTMNRSYFVSLNNNKQFEIISNYGEAFEGFFTFSNANNSYILYFPPKTNIPATDVFTQFSYTPLLNSPGYAYAYTEAVIMPTCQEMTGTCKTYYLPKSESGSAVHTGSYGFKLEAGKAGTSYVVHPTYAASPTVLNEYKRRYKAMVWVHNSSSLQTKLIVKITNNTNPYINPPTVSPYATYTASMANPYLKAGNWSLLRVEFDLSSINPIQGANNYYALVYVKNDSQNGQAIYDDMRVLPYYAETTNWVFEPKFNRVVSGLDNDNYASYSNYDSRGRAVSSAIELQNDGKKEIQKFLYNDQKK